LAATAAYVAITRIAKSGVATDNKTFANISATSASFPLLGGTYGMSCVASTYGTVTLQTLAADGSTWLTAMTAFAANGYESADLPSGTYRVALA
jgi:hypothetical protein